MRLQAKTEPVPILDPETMVVATESFRPGAIARMVERGQWMRLDSDVVKEHPGSFAVPLDQILKRT